MTVTLIFLHGSRVLQSRTEQLPQNKFNYRLRLVKRRAASIKLHKSEGSKERTFSKKPVAIEDVSMQRQPCHDKGMPSPLTVLAKPKAKTVSESLEL